MQINFENKVAMAPVPASERNMLWNWRGAELEWL
jgi:hypothetical protein